MRVQMLFVIKLKDLAVVVLLLVVSMGFSFSSKAFMVPGSILDVEGATFALLDEIYAANAQLNQRPQCPRGLRDVSHTDGQAFLACTQGCVSTVHTSARMSKRFKSVFLFRDPCGVVAWPWWLWRPAGLLSVFQNRESETGLQTEGRLIARGSNVQGNFC